MKFRCASNATIKNVKIARKKINFFSKIRVKGKSSSAFITEKGSTNNHK